MKKVLVTGFDPFGGEATNPSYEAVKRLPDSIDGVTIIKLQIPTVFQESIKKVTEAIELHQPDVVINIGQAGGRFDITPERVAINQDDARIPDNKGNQPIDTPIVEGAKPAYFSTLPIKSMVKNIKEAGVQASVSNTAGTFVCNHVMYGVLQYIDTHEALNHIRAGFIHVPFIPEQVLTKPNMPAISLDQLVIGLTAAIKTVINQTSDEKLVGGATH